MDLIWASVVIIFLSAFLAYKCFEGEGSQKYFYVILLVAFLVRAGMGFIFQYSDFIPEKYFLDATSYKLMAWDIAEKNSVAGINESISVLTYAWLLSFVFSLFGYAPLTSSILTGTLSVVTVRNIYRTSEMLSNARAAAVIAAIWAVMPSFVFVTSQTFRDPIIFFLITTIFYWVVLAEKEGKYFPYVSVLGCLLFWVLLCRFRLHHADIFLGVFAVVGLSPLRWYQARTKSNIRQLRILGFGALLIFGLSFAGYGPCHPESRRLLGNFFGNSEGVVSEINSIRQKYAFPTTYSDKKKLLEKGLLPEKGEDTQKDGSYYSMAVVSDMSFFEMIYRIPLRMLNFLLSPFPWEMKSIFLKIAVLENLVFYFFLILGVFGLYEILQLNGKNMKSLFVFVGISMVVGGMFVGNIGTGYRQRMEFAWLLYIPGAFYISSWIGKMKKI